MKSAEARCDGTRRSWKTLEEGCIVDRNVRFLLYRHLCEFCYFVTQGIYILVEGTPESRQRDDRRVFPGRAITQHDMVFQELGCQK